VIVRGIAAVAATLALVAAPAASQSRVDATVVIDPARTGPVIERAVYGQFAENLGRLIYDGLWVGKNSPIPNVNGYRSDVLEALKRIRVPVIRWPGGCYADEYHWRDGIGPTDKRPVRINTHWGWVHYNKSLLKNEFMD
jgi:alpha-N-arabinofuranosidase